MVQEGGAGEVKNVRKTVHMVYERPLFRVLNRLIKRNCHNYCSPVFPIINHFGQLRPKEFSCGQIETLFCFVLLLKPVQNSWLPQFQNCNDQQTKLPETEPQSIGYRIVHLANVSKAIFFYKSHFKNPFKKAPFLFSKTSF